MPAVRKLSGDTQYVIEAYRNGSNIRELAAAYGVAPGTIRNLLIRHNEPLRRPGRPSKTKVEEAQEAPARDFSEYTVGDAGDSNESV